MDSNYTQYSLQLLLENQEAPRGLLEPPRVPTWPIINSPIH